MAHASDTVNKSIVFLCKCSSNISSQVDFSEIKEWAHGHHDIKVVAVSNLLCAPDGKKFFKNVIRDRGMDNIVVAACSPKLHEKTFQDLAGECGINMSSVQMANIREQCAWVTADKKEATEKSKAIINAAVKRLKHSSELKRMSVAVQSDIVVIGGGIAGIEAAKTLSKAGRKVYLIEKNISIGGSVMKTEEVAPNMECSPCMMAPLLSDIRDDKNIEVISNAEVTDILGFFGNFTVKVKKRPRFVEESCIACEECFSVCPVSVDNEYYRSLGKRKAIYTLFPGSVPAAAVIDKERCLHFIDGSCSSCVSSCPFGSINFDQQEEIVTLRAGALVVATGFKTCDMGVFSSLGYGKIDNVITSQEFEILASTNGPTGGKILLKNGEVPSSLAVIHCAGSMTEKGIPYCSGICCTHAVKAGELLKKKNPSARVTNIHNDLVFTSPGEFGFYRDALSKGTRFIKCPDLSSIEIMKSESGTILIQGKGMDPVEADMAVLVTGVMPSDGTREIAGLLDAELDKNGFFHPSHELLNRIESSMDGVYVAGCASAPVNVAVSVMQAQAASGDILSKLVPGREIELEIYTSSIDEERCAGCRLCISVCPYKAIYFNTDKSVSVVNEAICRGCGTCAAACPGGAVYAKHFTDDEINAEIEGILHE